MNAHFLRGRLLLDQQRFEQAIAELRLAVSENPEQAFIQSTLTIALLRANRWQEAMETIRSALAKEPDDAYNHWVLTLVWLERNHLKEAEESIKQAIEIDPDDADHHGLLARVLYERNRFNEALAAADAGLALDASNDLSLTYRARALMSLGQKSEAHAVADTLLSENPDDAWNHCLRGDQLVEQGDYENARTHYLEALRLDPRFEAARIGLATCLKARSPIYGLLLKGLLFLSRFTGWSVWAGLILFFLAIRFGDAFVLKHPEWLVTYEAAKMLLWAVLILFAIANPVFDLLLRFDRDGQHALSEDERRATNWYLACFGFAALCAAWAFTAKSSGIPRGLGIAALFFCRAISETFSATPGYVRQWMARCTIIAACCLMLSPFVGIAGLVSVIITKEIQPGLTLIRTAIWLPVAVVIYSAFADDIREWFEQRQPDAD